MNNKDRSLRGEKFNETRLHNLVAVTIETFVISAKENLEDVEEPLRVQLALIELAATSIAEVDLERDPNEVWALVLARLKAILLEHIESWEAARRLH